MRSGWYGVVALALMACAGCVMDPGYGSYPSRPGYPYPGGGYPSNPSNPYPGYPYPDSGNGRVFRCESRDNRTEHCRSDTRGGVRLTRQLSDSPCVQGQTWGQEGGGVWVSRGCRGEFVSGYGSGGGGYPGAGSGGRIRCESDDKRTRHCPANTRGGVRLVRQLSSTPCVEGRNWGHDSQSIWVSQGCRAEFEVGRGGGDRPQPGHGQIVRCESRDSRQRRCPVTIRQQATLVRQLSSSPCIRGTSWGWDGNGIWVSGGCRAEFSVR